MFQVNARIRFVPDTDDPLSFPEWRGRIGTVVNVGSEPYPYTVRFDFNSKEWPVKATELESLGEN